MSTQAFRPIAIKKLAAHYDQRHMKRPRGLARKTLVPKAVFVGCLHAISDEQLREELALNGLDPINNRIP